MLHSIRNLCLSTWANLVAALGTTTLSILLFSFAIPLAIFGAMVVAGWREQRQAGKSVKQIIKGSILSWQTLIPSIIYLVAWMGLLGSSLGNTVYKDHEALLTRVRNLAAENKSLKNENELLRGAPPKMVTRTLPAPKPEEKCFMENIGRPAPQTVPDAKSSIETFIYCTYERKAPLALGIMYDKPPLRYGVIEFPDGRIPLIDMVTHEQSINFIIHSPSILPFQPFLVTAYGRENSPPIATKMVITLINPEQ